MRNAKSFMFVRTSILTMAVVVAMLASGCSSSGKPNTPVETFKSYINAAKKKDTTGMKLRLSAESIKMHEQQAKAQSTTLDDVVKQETLFNEGQKVVEFRDEKIDGDKATLQVKNTFGTWETVSFVLEDGEWKIDKKGYADRLMQEIEQSTQQMDDFINQGKEPTP
ncbi:MAG TPA: hypothetical protein VJV05_07745 [Pyrinomonadaceae bacterium]|nr:hypothetical protein [Pyrinomonadaceae bacterium]